MNVKVLMEAGYEPAMLGLSLSWASSPERAKQIASTWAFKQGGENKFLRSMQIWVDVTAPRYWWQEMATYTVGCTSQSASTMHTITKGYLSQDDFEYPIYVPTLDHINNMILRVKDTQETEYKKQLFNQIKNDLPEGFLQRRIMCISYAALQNMYNQRYSHKLPQWRTFLDVVVGGLEHPEFIAK